MSPGGQFLMSLDTIERGAPHSRISIRASCRQSQWTLQSYGLKLCSINSMRGLWWQLASSDMWHGVNDLGGASERRYDCEVTLHLCAVFNVGFRQYLTLGTERRMSATSLPDARAEGGVVSCPWLMLDAGQAEVND